MNPAKEFFFCITGDRYHDLVRNAQKHFQYLILDGCKARKAIKNDGRSTQNLRVFRHIQKFLQDLFRRDVGACNLFLKCPVHGDQICSLVSETLAEFRSLHDLIQSVRCDIVLGKFRY